MQICVCFCIVSYFISIEGFFTHNFMRLENSTRQCLDHKNPDRANNIKKATRYGCDALRQNNNKAETSRALSLNHSSAKE